MESSASNNKDGDLFSEKVKEKECRKLKAQKENSSHVWYGFGMFGMVGWSVVVPSFLGAVLGRSLDKKYPVSFSWTLTFLLIGLLAGCTIAWHWVSKNNNDER
jgi:ATP synthase protein I